MNLVTIIGRLTSDPEVRYSNGSESVAFGNYTLAVDRPKTKNGDNTTDFILCKVVGKPAEFTEKYLRKGMKIAINGRIQVDKYTDKNGNIKNITYVQVKEHEFCESRQAEPTPQPTPSNYDGFMNIPDGLDDELPFE